MRFSYALPALLAGLCVFGCRTIYRAREAQRGVEPKGDVAAVASTNRVDLRGYSLSQLVDWAVTNRPSYAAQVLAVENARLALYELAADAPALSRDGLWRAVHLSASGGYSASSHTAEHVENLSSTTYGDASGALSLQLLIWDWGRYGAQAKAKAEELLAAEMLLIDEWYTVFGEVSTAYFNVLEADALLDVARTNEYVFAEHLQQEECRLEVGDAMELDVLRARLDFSQAREATVAASNEVESAGIILMRALGIEASRGSRADVLTPRESPLSIALRELPETDYDVDSIFLYARTNSPAIMATRANLRSASASVDYAIADLMPKITATASLNWMNPLWLWDWGVSGVQDIFTGFRKTTAIDRSVVAMEIAAAEVDSAEQQLSGQLGTAIATRDNAREALAAARVSVRRARENLAMLTRQLEIGEVSRIEFSDSVSDCMQALGARVTAFYRGQRAEAALYAMIGRFPTYVKEEVNEE